MKWGGLSVRERGNRNNLHATHVGHGVYDRLGSDGFLAVHRTKQVPARRSLGHRKAYIIGRRES